MLDTKKTKAQLIEELTALKSRCRRLEAARSTKTDRRLREWILRYELVVAASGQIAYEYDVLTGRILWGATIEKVLGYSMEEISGGFSQWMDLLHPDDRATALDHLERAKAACSYWDEQYRMRHKDGHYVYIRDRGFFVADRAGRVTRQLGMLEDITERKEAEEALAESRQQASFLADLLERSSQPFGVGYPDGRMGICNAAFLRMVGYSREEFASISWAGDLTPPEWLDAERKKLAQLQRTGQPVRYEKEYFHKDGSRVPIELLVHLTRDEQGRPKHYYAFVTDITKRKQAEDALRASESFLRGVIEQNPCAMWVSDDQGKLLKLNQACRDLLQISDEEVVGKYNILRDNIVEEAGLMPLVRRVFEKGEVARFELEYDSSKLRGIPLEHSAVVVLDVTIFPIKDAAGRVTSAVIQHMDITERKKAERALQASEARYRALVEQIPLVTYTAAIDETSTTTYVSPQIERMIGYSPRDYIADPGTWDKGLHPEDRERVLAEVARTHASDAPFASEYRMVARDGRVVWVRDEAAIVRDSAGRPFCLQGVMSDITERKRTEEALRESEERFRQVVENINEVLWLTDWVNRELLYVSPSYETVYGRSRESLYQDRRSWIKAIHPEDRTRIDHTFAAKGERGEYTEEEYRIIQPDGAVRWVRDRSFPVYNARGEVTRWVGVAEDFTERKLAEEALRQERDFAESLIETAQAIILVLDPQGRIVRFNPYLERLSGRKLEDVQGADWFDSFVPEPSRSQARELFLRAISNIQTRGNVDAIVAKDGRRLWLEWYDKTLKDSDGRVVGLLAIGQDITERRQAEEALQKAHDELEQRVKERTAELTAANQQLQEEAKRREATEAALRESRDLLRAVMDGISDVIFTKNLEGRYCLVNAAITTFTGKSPKEVIGQSSDDIFPAEEARRRIDEDRIIAQTKAPVHRELTFPVHGQPRSFLLSKMPHLDSSGGVIGIIGIARDITEFKHTQDLLQRAERLASIGTLATGIAHEINNPIGAIFIAAQNALSCLEQNGDRQELTKCLADILEDAGRCGQIVRNILRFARQEPLEKEIVDIATVVRKAVEGAQQAAEQRGVTVRLSPPSGSPKVMLNTVAMTQVLDNVIRNGILASKPGDCVYVELGCEKDRVRVVVRDAGCGLTAEQQAHIFDPFYTSRRMEGGVGLGLSIVHGVIGDHGGTIDVKSRPGHGTVVMLSLPASP